MSPEVTRELGNAMTAIEYAHHHGIDQFEVQSRIDAGALRSMLHGGVLFVQHGKLSARAPAANSNQANSKKGVSASADVTISSIQNPTLAKTDSVAAIRTVTQQDEDAWYEQALDEVEAGHPAKAIWARALAEANGVEAKENGTYIRLRVAQLKTAHEAEQITTAEAEQVQAEQLAKVEADRLEEERRAITEAGRLAKSEADRQRASINAEIGKQTRAKDEAEQQKNIRIAILGVGAPLFAVAVLAFFSNSNDQSPQIQASSSTGNTWLAADKAEKRVEATIASKTADIKRQARCAKQKTSIWTDCVGERSWPKVGKYEGEFKNNEISGHGSFTYSDGTRYIGEWAYNKQNGEGIFAFATGDRYVGSFKDGSRNGQGTFTYVNGNKHVGEWLNDKQNGQGIFYGANGTILQQGNWVNGEFASRR